MTLMLADIPSGDTGRYGTTKSYMMDGIWADVNGGSAQIIDDPDPNITGNVLDLTSSYARYVYPGGAVATAGMGCRVYLPNIPTGENTVPSIHQYRGGSNQLLVTITVSPTGSIRALRWDGATSTELGETTGPVLVANSWRHVESKVLFSDTVGTVEVRVEGVVVLNLTSQDTNAVSAEQCAIGVSIDSNSVPQTVYFKDVTFWNGSGTQNNTFLGPCGVYRLTPNADVSSGWTRTSGTTDYELVDEAPPNDADYIYAGDPPPAASIMQMTNLPADIISVRGVISVIRAQKSDGGDGTLQNSMSPDGTNWDAGADNAISTAFSYYYDVSEVSPATAAAWTPTEVNAMRVRLNRTT